MIKRVYRVDPAEQPDRRVHFDSTVSKKASAPSGAEAAVPIHDDDGIVYWMTQDDMVSFNPLMVVKSAVSEVRVQEDPPKLSL